MLKYDARLKPYSRRLRSNMTDAEQLLWKHLRRKQISGVQFYRQKAIGRFIVDFYAPAISLVIELDGGQHFEPGALEYDQKRDDYLCGQGLQVMRFDNIQVLKKTDAVLRVIHDFANASKSGQTQIPRTEIPPSPPFSKGGIKNEAFAKGGIKNVAFVKGGTLDEAFSKGEMCEEGES